MDDASRAAPSQYVLPAAGAGAGAWAVVDHRGARPHVIDRPEHIHIYIYVFFFLLGHA